MLSVKNHIKYTIKLAVPVIIGQLGFIMMGVVDIIMVGGIGHIPLAAASIGNSLTIIVLIVGIGISMAVTPLVAISVGANKYEECGVYFRQSSKINMTIAVIIVAIIYFGALLIRTFDQPEEVIEQAITFTRILGFSAIPILLFQTFKQFIEGFSIMRPAMIIAILANLINLLFNWILIYGKLGFPEFGLSGSALATFISRLFMAVVIIIYVLKSNYFKEFDLSIKLKDFDLPVIKRILRIGLPSGIQYFFEVGAFSFAVIMIGWIGSEAQAAHQIAINLASVSFMAALGVSLAGSIRVGNAVGRKNIVETRKAGFTAIGLGASVMFFAGVIFITLNDLLPGLYISDPNVISIASKLLIIAALFQLSDGTQAVGIGVLRGLTDVKAPTIITFVAYWIIGLPCGYLLGFIFNLGVEGIWIGLLIGLTCSAVLLTLRFNQKSKNLIEVK
ncbi:MAG: MATE family efflux transporter [Ignavibacteriaceae bacterium]|nr:MATE family efflux transporter [Ignavibacteriaceae bacterium]